MKRTKIIHTATPSVSPLSPNDRKGPRPTIPTPALIAGICAKMRHGIVLETAALVCGVTRLTLHRWLRTADAALARPSDALGAFELLCVELVAATNQAAAEADIRDMAIIAKAAKTDWRAAAWILNHWEEMAKQAARRGMPAVGPAKMGPSPARPAVSHAEGSAPAVSQPALSWPNGSNPPKRESRLTAELRELTARLCHGNVRRWGAN